MKNRNKKFGQSKIFGHGIPAMNLQLFAEGDGAGSDKGEGNGTSGQGADGCGGAGGENEPPKPPKPKTFDEILTNKEYQKEFDRRINKALEKAQEKWKILSDEKASEADKLAKMTVDEKAEYLHRKREKELSDREKSISRRELAAEAKNTLAERKLPTELASVLDYSDADACKKSIDYLEKAFQKAVETAVQERLKGGKPPKAAGGTTVTKEVYAKMGYAERLKLKTENPELYKQLSGK